MMSNDDYLLSQDQMDWQADVQCRQDGGTQEEYYHRLLVFYREHRGEDVTSGRYAELCRAAGIDADDVYDNLMSLEMDCEFMV